MPEALPDAVGASNNSSIFALSLPAELTFAIVVGVVVEVVVVVPVGDTAVRRGGRVLVVKEGLRPIGHAIV